MDYVIRIVVSGEDAGASSMLGGIQRGLGGIAQIAAGGLIANGIMAIGQAIGNAGQEALQSVANYERLNMSLDSLLAREIKNASGIEKTIVVGQQKIQLTQKEIAEIGKLKQAITDESLARDTLGARIQEQKEHIRQLTEQYGENGLAVLTAKARLAEMENEYDKSNGVIAQHQQRIDELQGKEGQLASVTKKVVEGQLSMNEAMAQAGPKARDLLGWMTQLAIKSPFSRDDIANSFRQAMAFNFTSQEAQRLTQDLVDFSAATGGNGEQMRLISYALGQIHAGDQIYMQDLRQLMNAGVDVNSILKSMGFSLSDVGKKTIDSKKFLEAFFKSVESDFGGAAERQAGTLTGLLTSLGDIKEIGLQNLFTGIFSEAKPALQALVDFASGPEFMQGLSNIGTWIGNGVKTGIGWLQTGIGWVKKFKDEFDFQRLMGKNPLDALASTLRNLLPPELRPQITAIFDALQGGGVFVTTTLIPTLLGFGAQAGPVLLQFFTLLQQGGTWITGTLIPAFLQFAAVAGPQLGAGLQQLVTWGQQLVAFVFPLLVSGAQQIAAFALPLLVQGFAWLGQNMQIVTPILGAIAAVLGLIFAPIVAIPALLVLLGTAWANNWGGIQEKTQSAAAFLGPILQQIAGFFTTILIPALLNLGAQAGPVLANIVGFFTGTLLPALGQFAGWLQTGIPAAILNFQTAWTNAQPVLQLIGRYIGAVIGILTSLGNIWNNVNRLVNQFQMYLGSVITKFLGIDTSAQATQQRLQGLGDFLGIVGGIINGFIENYLKVLLQVFQWIVGALEELAHWLGIVADALDNLKIPDAFQRHSPSPFEQMLMNSNAYLREMGGLLPNALGRVDQFGIPGLTLGAVNAGVGMSAPGAAYRAAASNDYRRETHFHGPINVHANDARAFWRSMQDYENGVITSVRFGEG